MENLELNLFFSVIEDGLHPYIYFMVDGMVCTASCPSNLDCCAVLSKKVTIASLLRDNSLGFLARHNLISFLTESPNSTLLFTGFIRSVEMLN